MRHRHENFGGIISSDEPPFLAFVDRAFMREMGLGPSPLWDSADESVSVLSAPTEVHMAITGACPRGCAHCYMAAGENEPGELDAAGLFRAMEELAALGVFHLALGGGEALARPDLFEVAGRARDLGLVPNLTVSGALLTPEAAQRLKIFGQVNVSLDGPGELAATFRGPGAFELADRALSLLLDAGVSAGINCVLGRRNFDGLPGLFEHAERRGAGEIEILRYKPAGRAAGSYLAERTTYEQNCRLAPLLAELSRTHRVTAKVDCSFIPMLCEHDPPREMLEATATWGCEAGNVLVGARSSGRVAGCSFLPAGPLSVFDLHAAWRDHPYLVKLRGRAGRLGEPCRSCPYLQICKGGCQAISAAVVGDADAPDPDCPRVVRFREGQVRK